MPEKEIVKTQTVKLFSPANPFYFESGASLPEITIAYETYGQLNSAGDNAIYVCHALTGSAHAAFYNTPDDKIPGWWHNFIGYDCPLDPRKYFIVCANILSSCYGTSGPISINPRTNQIYGMNFPATTTRDMIRVQKALLDFLGVKRLACVVGGSLGAMQTWEWLVQYPDFIDKAIPIAGTAKGSPWMIALNEIARQAIYNDPNWNNGDFQNTPPNCGLHLARMIGMITYRSQVQFQERYGRDRVNTDPEQYFDFKNWFQVESYLHYQGDKLVRRFDARSYIYLTKAMDLHDISRGFDNWEAALSKIQSQVLVIGISSDVLYYPDELKTVCHQLQDLKKKVQYVELVSKFGHDSFLIEYDKMNSIVNKFLNSDKKENQAY